MINDKEKITIGFVFLFIISVLLIMTSLMLFTGAFFYDVSIHDFIMSIVIGIFLMFISWYCIFLAYESKRLEI